MTWQSTQTSYRLAFASLLAAGHLYVRPHCESVLSCTLRSREKQSAMRRELVRDEASRFPGWLGTLEGVSLTGWSPLREGRSEQGFRGSLHRLLELCDIDASFLQAS